MLKAGAKHCFEGELPEFGKCTAYIGYKVVVVHATLIVDYIGSSFFRIHHQASKEVIYAAW